VEKKVILKGRFNEHWSDQTHWYAFTDEVAFLPKEDDSPKRANGNLPNGQMPSAQMGTSTTDNKPNPEEREKEPPVELPRGFPKTVQEAIAASISAGVPDEFVRQDWAECHSRGGKDRQGHPILFYASHVTSAFSRSKSYREEQKSNGAARSFMPSQPNHPPSIFALTKQIESLEYLNLHSVANLSDGKKGNRDAPNYKEERVKFLDRLKKIEEIHREIARRNHAQPQPQHARPTAGA
jgi:hypothetical protein